MHRKGVAAWRYLTRLAGLMVLTGSWCSTVAAQTDSQPAFGAASEPALIFTAGTAQTAAALPMATGGDGVLSYAIDSTTPLPAGVTFNAAARTVTADATAAAQAQATYRLVAMDADNDRATLAFTIAIVIDYDADDDGLIAIATLAQLDAVRHDLDGDGSVAAAYAAAFPHAAASMGCPPATGCHGYELTTDLDFDQNDDDRVTAADAAYWDAGAGWVPIGHGADAAADSPFRATLRGNGHTISHLFIHRSARDFVGLFYQIGGDARVEGLTLQDVQIWGRRHVGGIAGSNVGAIVDSLVSGTVTGSDYRVGGVAGDNYGRIVDDTAAVTVSGHARVGGLVGLNGRSGGIVSSAARGAVTASDFASGGLVGYNLGGTITTSYATGTVTSSADSAGGLAGINEVDGAITLSYATGAVTSSGNEVGGLVGLNRNGAIVSSYATGAVIGRGERRIGGLAGVNTGAIIGSYATGAVTSSGDEIGGLVGHNGTWRRLAGRIAASYATGTVTASSSAAVGGLVGNNRRGVIAASYARGGVAGRTRVGGLVGNDTQGTITASYVRGAVSGRTQVGGLVGNAANTTITASYWDTAVTGQTTSSGGTGQTTRALQAPTAYTGLYATWNVDVDDRTGNDNPWDFGTHSQYPALRYGCPCRDDQRDD